MVEIKYTLVADGSSDSTLLKIIKWLMDDLYPEILNEGQFADFRNIPKPPKDLQAKIEMANRFFPFDILFVHRDAESSDKKTFNARLEEIVNILNEQERNKTVCVVPVRMMEAWLLIDVDALKKAAGNRNYTGEINLPTLKRIETLSDPKETLYALLRQVSGLKSRNLEKFNASKAVHLLADNIEDFSLLRNLDAFRVFERDLKQKVEVFLKKCVSQ